MTWALSAAMYRSCSLRGVVLSGAADGSTRALTNLSALLLALPCSPWNRSTGYGPVGRSAATTHRSQRGGSRVLPALLLAGSEPHRRGFFSKIKALVRKAGARVREALVEAIGRALAAVIPEDAAGWFVHAGYWPQDQPL
jgi:hypothetical protein